jgi:formylglycine-generating enzyme required for sulfatase activity
MGIDEAELGDAIDACKEEFGPESGALACEQMARFQDAATGQAREVYVSPFLVDRTEVTGGEYRRCVIAGACDPTPLVAGDTRFIRDDLPVVNVTWYDAVTYCGWLGKRLPTEAEWEKAARGDDGRRFPWGNATPDCERASFDNCRAGPARVGSHAGDASPAGATEMAGNVAEWTADYHASDYYVSSPDRDPRGPSSGDERVVRGGDFESDLEFLRTFDRDPWPPSTSS